VPPQGGPPSASAKGVPVQADARDCAVSSQVREALARSCAPTSWSPDPATILLSNNGSLCAPGREEFRTLRSRLNLVRERQGIRKLLVTSPLPEEGKTFVAANLAQVMLWQREHQVLLIDADLRASRLQAVLGAPAAPGLSDYLSNEADEFSIIKQREPVTNFFFIPAGKPAPNASELLGNGRLKLLLERLAPAFDWIMIAELCDGVLLVVQAGTTPIDLAQMAYKDFRDRRFLGVVLNRARRGSTYGYDNYYYERQRAHKS
jgi:protein-tyrosine kinase